jgi:hypothetical protein
MYKLNSSHYNHIHLLCFINCHQFYVCINYVIKELWKKVLQTIKSVLLYVEMPTSKCYQ